MVQANLDDVNSLINAFQGVNAIFGVTDFWQFAKKQSTQEIARSKGITWNEASYLQEVEQGKNIIDAATHVMEDGILEKMVYSSLSDVKKSSKFNFHRIISQANTTQNGPSKPLLKAGSP